MKLRAREICVWGIVQGVGFRPFVYQLAVRNGLHGWVCNTSENVRVWIEGPEHSVIAFSRSLRTEVPPRAVVEQISSVERTPVGYHEFGIRDSIVQEGKYQLISPDIATCSECLREIRSPGERRYRYPFTNCTNCGPRFTIISEIPYDRKRTTMNAFEMCPECRKEYGDPRDRRFHAQPIACPVCGPKLELLDNAGRREEVGDVISATARLLKDGKIVAIKGLGGFLLACDATNSASVDLLRNRKKRPAKPFAIMVGSLEEAQRLCHINRLEQELLESPRCPIVLLRRRDGIPIAPSVAPNLKYLGVMLPYTPLHHLLLAETELPLVMTSGNLSEEPIARENEEALARLAGIPDYFLVHNREIYSTYDDSVTAVELGRVQVLRRARGYAPYPLRLAFEVPPVLACGAHEKNTFCLTRDSYAFVSQHIGDLDGLETLDHYSATVDLYKRLFRVVPETVAYDMHPDYGSTAFALDYAAKNGVKASAVQHHHAHIVSGMVDNGLTSRVIGVAMDGTGYGVDGRIWGGEFMVADFQEFTRLAHLEYLPLPGGGAAVRRPYRTALGFLLALLGPRVLERDLPFLVEVDRTEIEIIRHQVKSGLNCPLTSSMGRLFDAVSALIGVRGIAEYDAQAAIELEMLAMEARSETGAYPISPSLESSEMIIRLEPLFRGLIADVEARVSRARIAARFHNAVAALISCTCRRIADDTGLSGVVLSGGVFQNRLLLRKTVRMIEASGLRVGLHHQVPCNDGGISLGQAVIAASRELALRQNGGHTTDLE